MNSLNKGNKRAFGQYNFNDNDRGKEKVYNPIKRAKKSPTSYVKAIKAMCFHCFGGTEEGAGDPYWKEDVRNCSSYGCPLRHLRPYRQKGE